MEKKLEQMHIKTIYFSFVRLKFGYNSLYCVHFRVAISNTPRHISSTDS